MQTPRKGVHFSAAVSRNARPVGEGEKKADKGVVAYVQKVRLHEQHVIVCLPTGQQISAAAAAADSFHFLFTIFHEIVST